LSPTLRDSDSSFSTDFGVIVKMLNTAVTKIAPIRDKIVLGNSLVHAIENSSLNI